ASHVVFSIVSAYLAVRGCVNGPAARCPTDGGHLASKRLGVTRECACRFQNAFEESFADEHTTRGEKATIADQSAAARADAAISQAASGKARYRIEARAAATLSGRRVSGSRQIGRQGRADHRRRFGHRTR